ncbi:MAG: hypothetical protein HQK60_01280 [Deltaproteobacteria bacterium]|nr:hypothetical protein [Deltaproteobacteria bacterium]
MKKLMAQVEEMKAIRRTLGKEKAVELVAAMKAQDMGRIKAIMETLKPKQRRQVAKAIKAMFGR